MFKGQTRVLLTSLALVVVATAVAMVPASAAQSGWLEILAALAAMTAGAPWLCRPDRARVPLPRDSQS